MRATVTFLLLSLASFILNAQIDPETCKDLEALAAAEARHARHLIDFRTNELTYTYDLKYHRLEWEIDPSVRYIKGTVTSYFTPTETGFEHIHFDFSQQLTVNSVLYHGQPVPFLKMGNDVLRISLPAEIAVGRLDSISVNYEGEPTSTGSGAFEQNQHNGMPVIWTLSEPYGAKEWWPCKQDLNDKIDSIDVWVRTPSAYRVASNGVLAHETQEGDWKRYHWRHRYPIAAYLVAIAVTNYATYSHYVPVAGAEDIEVLNYVYPEDLAAIQPQTQRIVPIMSFFNNLLEVYPFAAEKYGHAQFGWGGGMEHQTMSFMGGFSFMLQSHELAHQWFGDKVTCGSWEDIWLNEGFATYMEGLNYNFGIGPTDWQAWLWGKINSITSQPGGSVWVDDTTNVGRIFNGRLSYSKGAMLLHMLRWKLGDDDFFQALRNYLADPRLAYGYARTADLQRHLEAESGQDLDEFFEDWFQGQGYPSYRVDWQPTTAGISLSVFQTTSHPSVDFYEMPVQILVTGQGQDTLLRLDHQFSGQQFALSLPFTPDNVAFDPYPWLISAGNTVNMVTDLDDPVELSEGIRVYPNPVTTLVQVELSQAALATERIEIRDLQGRLLRRLTPTGASMTIDVTDLPAGAYVLRFYVGTAVVSRELIKSF